MPIQKKLQRSCGRPVLAYFSIAHRDTTIPTNSTRNVRLFLFLEKARRSTLFPSLTSMETASVTLALQVIASSLERTFNQDVSLLKVASQQDRLCGTHSMPRTLIF